MPTPSFPSGRLCESPGVRFADGLFQARLSLAPPWGSINLGLYPSEEAAAAARREVLRHLAADGHLDPLTVWRATRKGIQAGKVRADVLPKWVVRRGGKVFAQMLYNRSPLLGPYPTAVQALVMAMDVRLQESRDSRSDDSAAAS